MGTSIYGERHIGVLIGRFQPFHNGHFYQIEKAMEQGMRNFKIFIGSANSGRTLKNPFIAAERVQMITLAISDLLAVRNKGSDILQFPNNDLVIDPQARPHMVIQAVKSDKIQVTVEIYTLNDYLYNDNRWKLEFMTALFSNMSTFTFRPKHVLLGYKKDASSWYLDEFQELDVALTDDPYKAMMENGAGTVSATDIRKQFFLNKDLIITDDRVFAANFGFPWSNILPFKVGVFLDLFKLQHADDWQYLHDEYKFVEQYKKQWEGSPYPPIFVTTDALVQQGNNILMIKRRTQPGKNMWAMPGGFLKDNELLEAGMLRELREETGLRLPIPVLKRCIANRDVIDNPDRSSRGRTITHVFHIKLDNTANGLPAIRGASDATKAQWIPLHEVMAMKSQIFEDHWDIIAKLIEF